MDLRKRPVTSESKKGEKKIGGSKKDNEGSGGKRKEEKVKSSLIPKPKVVKNDPKGSTQSRRSFIKYHRRSSVQVDDDDVKLKSLEEKKKCLSEYFSKIEELIQSMADKKETENVSSDKNKCASSTKSCPLSSARKMISDPQVFKKGKVEGNVLSNFESNVQEISEIWLKTSADLTNTLKILKSNPSMDPVQLEVEGVRIQLAIKQAKSLTIVKTRNVIAEAKKLMNHREMIRSELENFLSREALKTGRMSQGEREAKTGGTGDSTKDDESDSAAKDATVGSSENKCEDSSASSQNTGCSTQTASTEETKTWAKELARKNEIIAQLHNKIFELQKACSEHSLEYNQLQTKLAEFHEKIQWDQVLWKQIGKLKELIKGLQQSNKQLESQKRELEEKITKLDEELQRLVKLNHVLNQQKYLMNAHEKCVEDCPRECAGEECRGDETRETGDKNYDTPEKILAEKQNLINQLNTILNLMKDQENVAQKQIAAFQSKIEELEKNSRT